MVLNNYFKYFVGVTSQPMYTGNSGQQAVTTDFGCKSMVDGQDLRCCVDGYQNSDSSAYFLKNMEPLYDIGIAIGTGTTPVTANDYQLANDVTSSLNPTITTNVGSDANGIHVVNTISGINTSGSSVTITEVGAYKNIYTNCYDPTKNEKCLFVRHILDSPITLAAGESYSFTFEWTQS